MRVATINVRGILQETKRHEVETWAAAKKIDIIGVQETHINTNQTWKGDTYTWFFSTGVPATDIAYRAKTSHEQRQLEGRTEARRSCITHQEQDLENNQHRDAARSTHHRGAAAGASSRTDGVLLRAHS